MTGHGYIFLNYANINFHNEEDKRKFMRIKRMMKREGMGLGQVFLHVLRS